MNEYMEKLKEIWGPYKEKRGYLPEGDAKAVVEYLVKEFPALAAASEFQALLQKANVPSGWRATKYLLDVDVKAHFTIPARKMEDVISDGVAVGVLTQSLTWEDRSGSARKYGPIVYRDLGITTFIMSRTANGYKVNHVLSTGDIDMQRLDRFSGAPQLKLMFQRVANNDELAVTLQAQEWQEPARRRQGFMEALLEKFIRRDSQPTPNKVLLCKSFVLN